MLTYNIWGMFSERQAASTHVQARVAALGDVIEREIDHPDAILLQVRQWTLCESLAFGGNGVGCGGCMAAAAGTS